MPTAALADIHGNVQALDAVLADRRLEAAEQVVVLSDVVAGTFPAETFDRLAELGDRVRILRGSHSTPQDDDAILTRLTPGADFEVALHAIDEAIVIGGHTHVQFDRAVGALPVREPRQVGRPCEDRPGGARRRAAGGAADRRGVDVPSWRRREAAGPPG